MLLLPTALLAFLSILFCPASSVHSFTSVLPTKFHRHRHHQHRRRGASIGTSVVGPCSWKRYERRKLTTRRVLAASTTDNADKSRRDRATSADAGTTDAAAPPTTTTGSTKKGFFQRLLGRIFWSRAGKTKTKKKQSIEQKALDIHTKAHKNLQQFEDKIEKAMQTKSYELIESIAADVTNILIADPWTVHAMGVAPDDERNATKNATMNETNTTHRRDGSTETSMDGTIADIANIKVTLEDVVGRIRGKNSKADSNPAVPLPLTDATTTTEEEEEEETTAMLKSYRLQWKMSYSGINGYPIQSQHDILFLGEVVIQFFGTIQFDLSSRQIVFVLDELTVLDVPVDLEKLRSTMKNQD